MITNKICLALDVDTLEEAEGIVRQLQPYVGMFKVGMQLYTSVGPEIVHVIHRLGGEVFLDLKFHDIPATVAKASRVATRLGVKMFNIHASGNTEMMVASVESTKEEAEKLGIRKPIVLSVTVLTTQDKVDLERMLIPESPENYVRHLATLSLDCGVDGVVCSSQELPVIRNEFPSTFFTVTPGIRPEGSDAHDQKRVMTPAEANDLGCNYMVIGRPILGAPDRVKAAKQILNSIT